MAYDKDSRSVIPWTAFGTILLLLLIAVGMYGCPQYNVYSSRMSGEAKKAEAVGSRQALVSQAQAEKEASLLRADAATTRVHGWVEAAKKGCTDLGRANDRGCMDHLIQQAATYSIAKEGHEGVIISLGASQMPVAVQPNRPVAPSEEK